MDPMATKEVEWPEDVLSEKPGEHPPQDDVATTECDGWDDRADDETSKKGGEEEVPTTECEGSADDRDAERSPVARADRSEEEGAEDVEFAARESRLEVGGRAFEDADEDEARTSAWEVPEDRLDAASVQEPSRGEDGSSGFDGEEPSDDEAPTLGLDAMKALAKARSKTAMGGGSDGGSGEAPVAVRRFAKVLERGSAWTGDFSSVAPRPRLVLAVVASLLVLGILSLLFVSVGGSEVEATGDRSRPSTHAEPERAFLHFQRGIDAIHAGDWRTASLRFAESSVLDPENPEPARYLEAAQREAEVADRLLEARRCYERGDIECGVSALAAVDRGSLAFEKVGTPLQEAIDAARLEMEQEVDAEEASTPSGGSPVPSAARKGEDAKAPRLAGGAQSRSGGGTEALLPRRPSSAVSDPRRSTDQGSPKQRGGAGGGATTPERMAGAGSRKTSSLPPAVAPAVPGFLDPGEIARKHVEAGVRARASGDLGKAADHFELALRQEPANAEAKAELDRIRGELPELFRQAYAERSRDRDGAREKLRLVVRLTAPGSELRKKAERWLAKVEAGP